MRGLPRVTQVRSISKAGLSQVVIVFEDGADTYWTRQVVFERLAAGAGAAPARAWSRSSARISTGLGEIFQYTLEGEGQDAMELRTIQDWLVAPLLKPIPGVNEVNSFGGYVKQYQVLLAPEQAAPVRPDLERGGRGHRAQQRQRGRRRGRARLGAGLPARRGPAAGHPGHRAHRAQVEHRRAGLPARRGRRGHRRRAAPGRGHARRPGRGRGRHDHHAQGRELEGSGRPGQGGDRQDPGHAAPGSPHQRLLRPHLAHRGLHRARSLDALLLGGALRHPRAVPVRRRAAHRAHRGLLAAAHLPRQLHRHGRAWDSPPT